MAYFNFHKCFCGSRNSAPPVPTPITAAQFAAAALFWDIVHHNKFCRELISLLELSIKSGNERWDFIKFAKNYRKKRNRRKRNTKHMALDGTPLHRVCVWQRVCTRTDIVAQKMEYNDSSVLIIVINIDITEILIELSDDCTRVVDFMRKMTASHWLICLACQM